MKNGVFRHFSPIFACFLMSTGIFRKISLFFILKRLFCRRCIIYGINAARFSFQKIIVFKLKSRRLNAILWNVCISINRKGAEKQTTEHRIKSLTKI